MFSFKKSLNLFLPMVALAMTFAYSSPMDPGQLAQPGDVNRDGTHDIRDVQAVISQAMHQSDQTPEGNLDGNDVVDIFDIQQCVNTALGTGGLVQRVGGRIDFDPADFPGGMHIRAISEDGQSVTGEVDPETGAFSMMLRTGTGWSLVSMGERAEGEGYEVGVMEFPVENTTSLLLPFPELSEGDEPDLGDLQFGPHMRVSEDLRGMHGWLNNGDVDQDADGDGIPDFMHSLMDRVQSGPGVFEDMEPGYLHEQVAACVQEWLDDLTAPSLVDENENAIPDFVEPLISCLESNMDGWFEHCGYPGGMMGDGMAQSDTPDEGKMMGGGMMGGGMMGNWDHQGPQYVADIIDYVLAYIPEWIANLDEPDLIDADGNGIPDFFDGLLETPDGPRHLDLDGDGIPDFAQDDDGDGIPNCLDEDAWTGEDCDGDGVPNSFDRDDDNDGTDDYADAAPCDPEAV